MKSIRGKLTLLISLAMLLAMSSITILTVIQLRSQAYSQAQDDLTRLSDSQSALVSTWLDSRKSVIAAGLSHANEENTTVFLEQLAKAGGYTQLFVGDGKTKDMVYSIPGKKKPNPEYDPSSRTWFKMASSSGDVIVTPPYKAASADIKELVISMAHKLDGTDKVLGGDIMIGAVTKAVLSVKLPGEGHAFMLTRDGKIIAYPKPGNELKPVTDLIPALDEPKIKTLVEAGKGELLDIDGKSFLVKLTPIAGSDWLLAVAEDKAEIDAPLNRLLLIIVGAALVVLLVVWSASTTYLRRLLQGLLRVRDAMREISQGEGDLTRRIQIDSEDEVAETAQAFNAFVERLNGMFRQLKEEAVQLADGVIDVSQAVERVATESNILSDISSSNAAAIEEVTVSISHIADAARTTDEIARATGSAAGESAGQMARISDEMSKTSGSVSSLAGLLQTLEQRSSEISKITSVISDIADQTNLLALNAAIEAARAGEMGRGFAVVADEVRKLAERTANATVEITGMVNTIIGETGRAVGNMQETIATVDVSVGLTESAREHMGTIARTMHQVVDNISAIALSTGEQQQAATSMAQSTESINNQIITSDEMLQRAKETLVQLNSVAMSMQKAFGRFKL